MLNRADQLRDMLVKNSFDAWGLAFFVGCFLSDVMDLDRAVELTLTPLKLNDTKVGVATLTADLDISD